MVTTRGMKKKSTTKSKSKSKTSATSGRSYFTYAALAAVLGVLVYKASNGNPTQRVSKLFQMMKNGMAGGEDVGAFDDKFKNVSGNKQHSAYDGDIAESFYNLATDFYEYGWGDSFHFGFRKQGEPHTIAIQNSQHFVSQKLMVTDMDEVLDMGCGIGGPLRGVVRGHITHFSNSLKHQHSNTGAKHGSQGHWFDNQSTSSRSCS